MTLHQIEIVAAIMRCHLNLSAASRKLGRVQSSISHQLQLLEKELGGRLFERHGKRLSEPTLLCRHLLPEIEKMLQAKSNLLTVAQEFADKRRGNLRIASTHTQARYFLPEIIGRFRSHYPDVKLTIRQGNPETFIELLKRRDIDLAIFAERQEVPAEMSRTKCYSWNRALVLRRDHPLASNEHPQLKDLAAYPIVTYMPGFADRSIIEQAFRQAGIPTDIVFSASDTDVIKTYVRLNLGIGIVAEMAAADAADHDLIFRSLSHLFEQSTTHAVHLKHQLMRQYIGDFIAMLQDCGGSFEKKLR